MSTNNIQNEYKKDISLIINEIMSIYKFKTKKEFAEYMGIAQQTINSWIKRNNIDYDLIYSKCGYIDGNWLLTGKGNPIRSTNAIQGDRNPIGNNSGMVSGYNVGDNSINISAPKDGKQKIIYPDRTIEYEHTTSEYQRASEDSAVYEVKKVIDMKDMLIASLEATIKAQNDTIESQKMTIDLLVNKK